MLLKSYHRGILSGNHRTSYSEAEIGTIRDVFLSCKVYLCDFHREQAWERWVKDRKHGLSPDEGESS